MIHHWVFLSKSTGPTATTAGVAGSSARPQIVQCPTGMAFLSVSMTQGDHQGGALLLPASSLCPCLANAKDEGEKGVESREFTPLESQNAKFL